MQIPAGCWCPRTPAPSGNRVPLSYRLSSLPGDAHVEVVEEVGAASEAQDGVGQLQGEVGRLAQLTGFREAGGDKRRQEESQR